MVTTVSPNPVYTAESRTEASGFGAHRDEGKEIKLFKGEYVDSLSSESDDLYMFYLEKGQVVCSFCLHEGARRTLFMRGEGTAFINENEPPVRKVGRVRYIARRDTVLVGFTRRQVYEFIAHDPALFDELLAIEHRAFVQIGYRCALVDIPSTSERILRWLHDLCEGRSTEPDGSVLVPCNLTLEGMSDFLNVHITTLSRLLSSLKKRGLLERTKTHLVVKDALAIRCLLEEDDVMLY